MKYFLVAVLFIGYSSSSYAIVEPPHFVSHLTPPFHLPYKGSGVGSLSEDFSFLLNPATLGFQRRSKSAIAYSIKNRKQMVSLVFIDLKTGIPLSINYERYWSSRLVKSNLDRVDVSLGTDITPFLSLGLTIHRETLKSSQKKSFWNGDLGALLRLGPSTGIGATLNQLLITERVQNRIATMGFYQKFMKTFDVRVDVSYSSKKGWVTRGAMETLFRQFLSLRVGSAWDFQTDQASYAGGLSLYGPRLQMDYSLEKDDLIFQHVIIFKLLM